MSDDGTDTASQGDGRAEERTLADIPVKRLVPRGVIDAGQLDELRASGYQTLADIEDAPVEELAQRDSLDAEQASELKEKVVSLAVESADIGEKADYEEWRSERLTEALRRAELRSENRLQATVTAVELEEHGETERVRIGFQYTDESHGIEVTAADWFEMPQVATGESDLVRLCEDLHIPFETAYEELPDSTVPIHWDDGQWRIVVEERDEERSWSVADVGTVVVFALPIALVFPLVSPLVFLGLWGDNGLPMAAGVTVGGLLVWLVIAGGLAQTLGFGVM